MVVQSCVGKVIIMPSGSADTHQVLAIACHLQAAMSSMGISLSRLSERRCVAGSLSMKNPSYLGSTTDRNGSKQAWADGGAAARDLAAKDLGLSFLFPSRHTAVLDQSIRCLPVRFSSRIKGFSRWL